MKALIIFLVLFTTLACSKVKIEDGQNSLPLPTEYGRGVFACYIDNQTYVVKKHDAITYNKTTGYLFIESTNRIFEFRLFVLEGVFGEGVYEFDNTNEEWVSSDYNSFFGINAEGTNRLIISKLDLAENVIAGRFDIDLIAADSTEKLVSNGRFDLEMNIIE